MEILVLMVWFEGVKLVFLMHCGIFGFVLGWVFGCCFFCVCCLFVCFFLGFFAKGKYKKVVEFFGSQFLVLLRKLEER